MSKISKIQKRDGRIVEFDQSKITEAIFKAARAVGGKDRKLAKQLSDRVVAELEKLSGVPKVEQIQDIVEKILIESGHAATAKAYILYRQERAAIRKEKQIVLEKEEIDEVDKRFDVNALRVLKARYLRKDATGKLIETPKQLFTRVAVHAALPDLFYGTRVFDIEARQPVNETEEFSPIANEDKYSIGKYKLNRYHLEALKRMYDRFNRNKQMKASWDKFFGMIKKGEFDNYEKNIDEFYNLMTYKLFMPNTPAIANFGNPLGMGSACFVLDVPDSIDGIMETLKNTAIVFKAGGGMGYNFSKLRPEGDFVSSTGGVASGPLSFMRLFDTMTEVIKQGGCVATDTIVRTDKGLVPIAEMLNSPPLRDNPTNYFVYDGKEYNYAWLAQNNGYAPVLKIQTELGNELKATGNHLVATATQKGVEWKRVDQLHEGDWLVTIVGGHQGKKIGLPRLEKQHHNANLLKMPDFLNEEFAELLGLYVSDGCFNRGRLLFSVDARDIDLIERIEYLVHSLFGLKVGEKRDKQTYIDIVFFSRDLENYFKQLKWCKGNAHSAFIPADILQSQESVAFAFLRGLFEGDGSVHPDGYPILYSSSKVLIDQVQQLLLSLGIVSKQHEVTKSENRYGKRQMHKIIVLTDRSIDTFEREIGFITDKKRKLFEIYRRNKRLEYSDLIPTFPAIFNKYYKRVGRGSGKSRAKKGANLRYYKDVYHYLKSDRTLTRKNLQELFKKHEFLKQDKVLNEFVSENRFFTRVTKISQEMDIYTMEIEVPSTSSYIANGLLVHNIRRGANMGILNSNHPDIEKFITAKEGNKALRNFNISVFIMSDFWSYYEKNEPYPLVNPKDGKIVRHVNPRQLFDKIVYQAWESAEPGVIFFDRVNEYNPFFEHLGPIVTTNPCGEVLLYPNEPCNLGSINVWAFARQDEDGNAYVDWDALRDVVRSCTRFLDNVIDVNNFPLKSIEDMSLATRKIGLGVMGVGDLLYELRLPYNTEEGRNFMEQLMEFIAYWSKVESIELAKKRGNLPYYDRSFYPKGKLPFRGDDLRQEWHFDWNKIREDLKQYGIRNGYTTIIAPTGSISMIAGCSSGMEPVYSLVYEKNVKVGSFFYVDPAAEKVLREEGLLNEKLMEDINEHKGSIQRIDYVPERLRKALVTAMDITPEDHIRALASFQKWVDSSISKTNNFPAEATVEHMRDSYILAYKLGCKDVTVFRDSSIKDQVLVAPKTKEKKEEPQLEVREEQKKMIKESESGLVFANENGEEMPTGKQIKNCPECGTELEKKEGCVECPSCGWGICM